MDLQWANSRSNGERPDAPVGAQGTPWVPAAASLQSLALEAAANAIFITDRSGRIIWTNPAFTRLTSYTAGEALGQNPRILKSGLHDPAYYAALWRTIGDGRVWHSEVTNRRKDGSFYIAEQTITPVREADGRITHFISISQDISQRRQAMEAQRRLTAIIEATTDFVATATVDGQLLYVNGAGRSMLGLAADVPLTGRTLFELHPPWAREIIEREAIPVAVRSGSWNGETALVGPGAPRSSSGRWSSLTTRPMAAWSTSRRSRATSPSESARRRRCARPRRSRRWASSWPGSRTS